NYLHVLRAEVGTVDQLPCAPIGFSPHTCSLAAGRPGLSRHHSTPFPLIQASEQVEQALGYGFTRHLIEIGADRSDNVPQVRKRVFLILPRHGSSSHRSRFPAAEENAEASIRFRTATFAVGEVHGDLLAQLALGADAKAVADDEHPIIGSGSTEGR